MAFAVHVYQLNMDGASTEIDDAEKITTSTHWLLPAYEFHGLWESLVFEDGIKSQVRCRDTNRIESPSYIFNSC